MKANSIFFVAWLLIVSTLTLSSETPKRIPIAVIVNKSNPMTNINIPELRRMMLGEVRAWANRRRITIVRRDPESSTFQTSVNVIAGMTAVEFQRHILNQEFRGEEAVPYKTLNSVNSACEYVYNVPGAIAFIEAQPVQSPPCESLVKVLSVNNKLPEEASYPLR